MTNKNKKTLFLMAGILSGIVFISSMIDDAPGALLGSVWFFRFGWFIMSASAFFSYYNLRKAEKK